MVVNMKNIKLLKIKENIYLLHKKLLSNLPKTKKFSSDTNNTKQCIYTSECSTYDFLSIDE